MINRTYETDSDYDPHGRKPQWQRFEHYVKVLNAKAPKNVEYKVLYMGRHGEGYHNVAESYYGTPAWDVSIAAHFLRIVIASLHFERTHSAGSDLIGSIE